MGMLLMLVFMSYNIWLCGAMVRGLQNYANIQILGAIVGFAFFGEVGSAEQESCH